VQGLFGHHRTIACLGYTQAKMEHLSKKAAQRCIIDFCFVQPIHVCMYVCVCIYIYMYIYICAMCTLDTRHGARIVEDSVADHEGLHDCAEGPFWQMDKEDIDGMVSSACSYGWCIKNRAHVHVQGRSCVCGSCRYMIFSLAKTDSRRLLQRCSRAMHFSRQ
jgi:hypothetical protein